MPAFPQTDISPAGLERFCHRTIREYLMVRWAEASPSALNAVLSAASSAAAAVPQARLAHERTGALKELLQLALERREGGLRCASRVVDDQTLALSCRFDKPWRTLQYMQQVGWPRARHLPETLNVQGLGFRTAASLASAIQELSTATPVGKQTPAIHNPAQERRHFVELAEKAGMAYPGMAEDITASLRELSQMGAWPDGPTRPLHSFGEAVTLMTVELLLKMRIRQELASVEAELLALPSARTPEILWTQAVAFTHPALREMAPPFGALRERPRQELEDAIWSSRRWSNRPAREQETMLAGVLQRLDHSSY